MEHWTPQVLHTRHPAEPLQNSQEAGPNTTSHQDKITENKA